jgi:hypothetical protein
MDRSTGEQPEKCPEPDGVYGMEVLTIDFVEQTAASAE